MHSSKVFDNTNNRYELKELFLSKIMQSKLNENHVYVVTQEGHPVLLDRRQNYKVIKKMPGAKGSVRDAITVLVPGLDGDSELVLTVGCDRFLRVFDPCSRFKHKVEIGHIYLKQRLNSMLIFE